jgi:hypothetical protein
MKFEIYNGERGTGSARPQDNRVGTAEWQGPGRVALEVEDPAKREWFESFFSSEDSTLDGPVECASMTTAERGDSSEEAFARALYRLGFYAYKFRDAAHGHAP